MRSTSHIIFIIKSYENDIEHSFIQELQEELIEAGVKGGCIIKHHVIPVNNNAIYENYDWLIYVMPNRILSYLKLKYMTFKLKIHMTTLFCIVK